MDKWVKAQRNLSKISKRSLIFITILFIFSIVFFTYALLSPQYVEQKIVNNNVTQKIVLDYKTKNLPDEIIEDEGLIFPKTQNTIDVSITSSIISQQVATVNGNYSIVLKLIAEGLWQKIIPLTEKHNFNFEGKENEIINVEVTINLEEIYKDIEDISNNIVGTRPSKYLLKIQPLIQGNVVYKSSTKPMDITSDITFEFSQSQVTLNGEKEFTQNKSFEGTKMIEHKLNILGLSIDIPLSRYIFGSISLLIFILFILIVYSKRKHHKKINYTEKYFIEKKYKNRLIDLDENIDITKKINIPLVSFKSLVRISDEKDQGILKFYNSANERTSYYVIDNDYVYTYTVGIKLKIKEAIVNLP